MGVATRSGTAKALFRISEVKRDGKKEEIGVELGELPEERTARPEGMEREKLGLTVSEITPQIANRLNLEGERGVIITSVDQGSIAAMAGLQEGDVILKINKKPIKSVGDYRDSIEELDKEGRLFFL